MIAVQDWASLACLALNAGAGLAGYLKVPKGERVAIHFNLRGVADRWAPAALGLALLPLVGLAVLGMTAWTGAGQDRLVVTFVQAVLCLAQLAIVARALRR